MRIVRLTGIVVVFLVICIAILTSALFFFKNVEKKNLTDEDRKRAGGNYITLKNGSTHYQVAGPDTGKVVILLHGFSVPYYIWDGTFEYLAKQGFRVVRYDMYGRGYSERPSVTYHNQLYLDQLHELITALKLKQPVSLAGVSFGGGVATDFAGAYPGLVNKVVLVDPVYQLTRPEVPQFVTLFDEAMTPDKRALNQVNDFKYPKQYPNWPTKYKDQMTYRGFRWAIASTEYNYHFVGKESYAKLKQTKKPVLLIWGKDDKTVPFKFSDSIRAILHPQFLAVDDAAHLPIIEKPELVNKQIAEFLKR
ncbi:alpha/beta hydrolase [Mucilaginibacter sp. RS28]|uniref:Alpha/beta hydrolase n=1 Tax=Mucilaginibacter straminoryzae TaxID=2932774 RepID=A0A9X1X2E4_9SPHI|nr:alpha/beta hydrolase [Mucilaginibacter straminoryzae]MCJ8209889.1 alpha/beta hydrolase [Mucilaginibacter straminoryzae]